MAHLKLSFLGPFQAVLDNTDLVNFESKKIKALMAYLSVETSRPHSRESLAGLFWCEYPQTAAQANLRNVLSKLRRTLADRFNPIPFLLITRETVQRLLGESLASGTPVWIYLGWKPISYV